ncbi:MAG: AEC family transporter [Gammaproteobacteria bacterium]|nr:AEC family transporter [Gammaproteobacteria bacterium]
MNLPLLAELFAVVSPIAICAAVGYGWARSPLEFPGDFVRRMVMWIGTPCLILATLDQVEIPSALLLQTGAAAITVVAITALAFSLLLRGIGLDRASFLPPMLFPNCGNMGLPVALFAFGDTGLALALAFYVAMTLMHFTVGVVISAGWSQISQVLRTPVVWAALLAITLHLTGISLPRWTANTFSLLGGMTIPLMLITLGVSLASIRVHGMGHALYLSILRLLGGALAGLLVASLFSLEGVAKSVVILQAAMPAAVLNYMLALQHGRAAREVASIVVISTLLSFITLPLLLAWLLP